MDLAINEDSEIPLGELPLLIPDPFSSEQHKDLDGKFQPPMKLNSSDLGNQYMTVTQILQRAEVARPDLRRRLRKNEDFDFLQQLLDQNKSFAKTVKLAIERHSFSSIRSSGK